MKLNILYHRGTEAQRHTHHVWFRPDAVPKVGTRKRPRHNLPGFLCASVPLWFQSFPQ